MYQVANPRGEAVHVGNVSAEPRSGSGQRFTALVVQPFAKTARKSKSIDRLDSRMLGKLAQSKTKALPA